MLEIYKTKSTRASSLSKENIQLIDTRFLNGFPYNYGIYLRIKNHVDSSNFSKFAEYFIDFIFCCVRTQSKNTQAFGFLFGKLVLNPKTVSITIVIGCWCFAITISRSMPLYVYNRSFNKTKSIKNLIFGFAYVPRVYRLTAWCTRRPWSMPRFILSHLFWKPNK